MPDEIVFGRILPAAGLMLFARPPATTPGSRWRLAQQTGRDDVCALPSGISVPHMFIVVLVIMLPIAQRTGDPIKAWEAGLTWVFIQSFILMIGGFVAPLIRRITPRAALLGTLAGVSVTFISMRPALEMFMTPVIGLVCFAIDPGGLVRRRCATRAASRRGWSRSPSAWSIAWGSPRCSAWASAGVSLDAAVRRRCRNIGFSVPLPAIDHVFGGFEFLGIILVTAIPFGIYDLVEAMDNVESAEAAGDPFPTTRVLTADGAVSLIGCLMGNPFINAVYIGHPGWKAMGGRIGYSAATGLAVLVVTWLGIVSRAARPGAGRRDLADPALHRHADRRAGLPGKRRSRTRRRWCWRWCRIWRPGRRR